MLRSSRILVTGMLPTLGSFQGMALQVERLIIRRVPRIADFHHCNPGAANPNL